MAQINSVTHHVEGVNRNNFVFELKMSRNGTGFLTSELKIFKINESINRCQTNLKAPACSAQLCASVDALKG